MEGLPKYPTNAVFNASEPLLLIQHAGGRPLSSDGYALISLDFALILRMAQAISEGFRRKADQRLRIDPCGPELNIARGLLRLQLPLEESTYSCTWEL